MKYGLRQDDVDLIVEAISCFPEVKEAVLFGSRAKGNFKNGSDVDIALKGERVSAEVVSRLAMQLNEELPLPYFFDVIHFDGIKEVQLTQHINRVGKLLYRHGQ